MKRSYGKCKAWAENLQDFKRRTNKSEDTEGDKEKENIFKQEMKLSEGD